MEVRCHLDGTVHNVIVPAEASRLSSREKMVVTMPVWETQEGLQKRIAAATARTLTLQLVMHDAAEQLKEGSSADEARVEEHERASIRSPSPEEGSSAGAAPTRAAAPHVSAGERAAEQLAEKRRHLVLYFNRCGAFREAGAPAALSPAERLAAAVALATPDAARLAEQSMALMERLLGIDGGFGTINEETDIYMIAQKKVAAHELAWLDAHAEGRISRTRLLSSLIFARQSACRAHPPPRTCSCAVRRALAYAHDASFFPIKDVRALAIRQHEIEHVLARRWRVWEIFERADKRERGAPAALARSHNGSGSGYSTASALGAAGEQLKGVPPQRRSLRDDPWAIVAAALRRTASSGAHTLR